VFRYEGVMNSRFSVLRLFDPWKNPLCTCRSKYSLHPYTGCSHQCLYCYATAYIGRRNSYPKEDFIRKLKRDLSRADRRLFVNISTSSDPYPPIEKNLMLTRRALEILVNEGFKILITTKSDLVSRDIDLLSKTTSVVSITITTLDEELAKIIEPYAPNPMDRLKAVEKLLSKGIPVCVRIDPIIPGLNDDLLSLKNLISTLSSIGVQHIVTSTYKARFDSLNRLIKLFPEKRDYWLKLYIGDGERIDGYMYLKREVRFKILEPIIRFSVEQGLSVATCREGLGPEFLRAPSCDGQHLAINNSLRR